MMIMLIGKYAYLFWIIRQDKAIEIRSYNFNVYKNEDLKRQFKKLSKLGYAALPIEKFKNLSNAITLMESNYAKVRICSYKNRTKCDLQLEPGNYICVFEIHEAAYNGSIHFHFLFYFLQNWLRYLRKVMIQKNWNTIGHNGMIKLALQFVRCSTNMLNWERKQPPWIVCAVGLRFCPIEMFFLSYFFYVCACLDFTSVAEMWLDEYEDSTFEQQLENIFEEIRPLYQQLHAYVRHALRAKFGNLISETGPIPMHLLGNMWAQTWDSVCDRNHHKLFIGYLI